MAAAKETEEEKAAKAASEAQEKEREEAAAAQTAAEAEAKATATLRDQIRAEEREKLRQETEEASEGRFLGQVVNHEGFVITTQAVQGRETVELKTEGWVGPGFEVAPHRVGDLKAALGKLKNLPKKD